MPVSKSSALLRLVVRRGRARLVLRHEGVELFLVLGVAQAIEEIPELDLLFLEPAQGFHAVLVEGAVAAGGLAETKAAKAAAFHAVTHPVHLVLHPLHLVLPAVSVAPATHFSAPECEKEKGKADRPPDDEAEDGHGDPAGMPGAFKHMRAWAVVFFRRRAAPSIDICGVGHFPLHDGYHAVVNVNNIYIPKPSSGFVKRAARRASQNYLEVPQGPDGAPPGGTGGGPDDFWSGDRRSVGKPRPRR